MNDHPVRFFFGANTPNGFTGFQQDLLKPDGMRAYLIKSGPGTGKNRMMREVLRRMTEAGFEGEAVVCSSDPDSLDAVVFHRERLCLIDATAPHVIEPAYWGAREQLVPICVCQDERILHGARETVREKTDACARAHDRCRKYIAAASSLLAWDRHVEENALDRDKVVRLADRIAAKELDGAAESGTEQRRFLSAVTPQGRRCFFETVGALCPKIYVLADEHGAAAGVFLERLRAWGKSRHLPFYTCFCPLFPQTPEHLLFPGLSVAFVTSNRFHKMSEPVFRRIHAERFLDTERMTPYRERMHFHRRAAEELLTEAEAAAGEAKAIHDEMEAVSAAAMDFSAVSAMTEKTVQKFLSLAGAPG